MEVRVMMAGATSHGKLLCTIRNAVVIFVVARLEWATPTIPRPPRLPRLRGQIRVRREARGRCADRGSRWLYDRSPRRATYQHRRSLFYQMPRNSIGIEYCRPSTTTERIETPQVCPCIWQHSIRRPKSCYSADSLTGHAVRRGIWTVSFAT